MGLSLFRRPLQNCGFLKVGTLNKNHTQNYALTPSTKQADLAPPDRRLLLPRTVAFHRHHACCYLQSCINKSIISCRQLLQIAKQAHVCEYQGFLGEPRHCSELVLPYQALPTTYVGHFGPFGHRLVLKTDKDFRTSCCTLVMFLGWTVLISGKYGVQTFCGQSTQEVR